MVKVNIFQIGYLSLEDWKNDNSSKLACRYMGYVELIELENDWEEIVWNILNWDCYQKNKPKTLHSEMTHCNDDVIFQIEGETEYTYFKSFGVGKTNSLSDAVQEILQETFVFYPFEDCRK